MHSVHTPRSVQMDGYCGGVKVAGGHEGQHAREQLPRPEQLPA
jgi:hypothetical protein